MIRIGELPIAPRPHAGRGRTLPYTGRRRRRSPLLPTAQPLPARRGDPGSPRADDAAAVNNGAMIFDQPPAELPVATLRPRDTGSQLLLDARAWLAARWRWLRPRSIPVAVAVAGMLGVLAVSSYLRELAHRVPEQLPMSAAPVLSSSGTVTVVGGGAPVIVKIGRDVYQLQLEPPAPAAR